MSITRIILCSIVLIFSPPAIVAGPAGPSTVIEKLKESGAGTETSETTTITISGRIVTSDGHPVANTPVNFVRDSAGGGYGGGLVPDFELFEGVPCLFEPVDRSQPTTDSQGRYQLRLRMKAECVNKHRARINADNLKMQATVEGYRTERAEGSLPVPVHVREGAGADLEPKQPVGGFAQPEPD